MLTFFELSSAEARSWTADDNKRTFDQMLYFVDTGWAQACMYTEHFTAQVLPSLAIKDAARGGQAGQIAGSRKRPREPEWSWTNQVQGPKFAENN